MRHFIQIVWGGITMLILTAVLANADTIFVDSIDDGICDCGLIAGCCNLRYAIAEASTGDTITFAEDLAGSMITLNRFNGQLTIAKNLTIDGDLDDDGAPDITISGDDNSRVFFLNDHMIVTLDGLIIRDGNPPESDLYDDGAGIFIDDGNFTVLKSCHIILNDVSYWEGGGWKGGGIVNRTGTLLMDNCYLASNEAGSGGAIYNYGSIVIINSSFYGNDANYGAGIYNASGATLNVETSSFTSNTLERLTGDPDDLTGAGIYNEGNLTVKKTTFLYNDVRIIGGLGFLPYGTAGGLFNGGEATIRQTTFHGNSALKGGALMNAGNLTMENCTLYRNRAEYGGGIYNYTSGAVPGSQQTLVIRNSTLYQNSAQRDQGGGIYLAWADGSDGEHITNTIIAGSEYSWGDDCHIVDGGLETNSNNLIQDGTCAPALSGDPRLGDLADNGGPTETLALMAGSPAINAGSNVHVPSTMTTDQRGTNYPRIQNGIVDIGAFEYYEPMMMFPVRTPDGKTTIITF